MRLKIGTSTGFKDVTDENICVGHNVRFGASYWYVNSYLQAVPYGEGKAVALKDLVKWQGVEICSLPSGFKQIGEVCPCRGMGGKKKVAASAPVTVPESAVAKDEGGAHEKIAIPTENEFPESAHRDIEKEILEGEKALEQVNHPAHYNTYRVEVIDMMVSIWGREKVADWCEITAFKYRMRMGTKQGNPVQQDLDKEAWYLDKAKELLG